MCLSGSVVSLDVWLNNEGFDMLGNVLLLVSGVMLSMRSFSTVSVKKDCCIKHLLRAGHNLFGFCGIKFSS